MNVTVRGKLAIRRGGAGRKASANSSELTSSRIPRVARLMALAIRFDQLIRDGVVADYADLARLGHVSRARVTQIMNLLNLAPDIQERLLFLQGEADDLHERLLRMLAAEPDWRRQRRLS
jgi:hypothetical protein